MSTMYEPINKPPDISSGRQEHSFPEIHSEIDQQNKVQKAADNPAADPSRNMIELMTPGPNPHFHPLALQAPSFSIQMSPNPDADLLRAKEEEGELEEDGLQMKESPNTVMTIGGVDDNTDNNDEGNSSGVTIQPKLTIGKPGDKYEQEADRIADTIMRMVANPQYEIGFENPADTLEIPSPEGSIQKKCEQCEEEEKQISRVQLKSERSTPRVPLGFESQLSASKGAGHPLPTSTNNFMSSSFGNNFSNVRIHNDSRANQLSSSIQAKAFTHGNDIYFKQGNFNPDSSQGKQLLAHELTHTIQQTGSTKIQRDDEDDTGGGSEERKMIRIPWKGTFTESYIQFAIAAGAKRTDAEELAKKTIATHNGWHAGKKELPTDQDAADYMATMDDPAFRLFIDNDYFKALGITEERLEKTDELLKQQGQNIELQNQVSGEPTTAVRADYEKLKNPALAKHFIQLVEHYTLIPFTMYAEMAEDGLDETELEAMFKDHKRIKPMAGIYTQGWHEFRVGNGKDIDRFSPLVRTVIEQFIRGNPNAVSNNLMIGYGKPEWKVLGICNRRTRQLYYDALGQPIASPVLGFLDKGFRATEPPEWAKEHGFHIDDPAVQLFVDILRQEFADPAIMIEEAAEVYFENIELVNAKVQSKLTAEIIKQFEDMLPFFIGFLAGHGVSQLLMRMAHPIAVGIGFALQGLLEAAGYLLGIDSTVDSLKRMTDAAEHLIQVKKLPDGTFSILSEGEMDKAAEILRKIVAEIAISFGILGLGKLISSAKRLRIHCTFCRLSTRMIDSSGKLTPEGIQHLRKTKFPGKSEKFIQDAFAKDLTHDRKGALLESLILEEIKQTHEAIQATSPTARIFAQIGNKLKTTMKKLEGIDSSVIKDKSLIEKSAGEFVDSNPNLKAKFDELNNHPVESVRNSFKSWYESFKDGKIGEKMPDSIEFFLDRNLAVITDPTLAVTSEFGPSHAFKTLFYKEFIEAATTLNAGAMDWGAGIINVIGD